MSDQSATTAPTRNDLLEVLRKNAWWLAWWGLATPLLAMLLGDLLGIRVLTAIVGSVIALAKPALDYYDLRERHREEVDEWLARDLDHFTQEPKPESTPVDDVWD